MGNKQLADSFKVLEQRQKSLDMRPASLQLAGGKNNRSMDELTSGGNEGSDSKEEEAPAIIVFIIGGMTYSEIRLIRNSPTYSDTLGWARERGAIVPIVSP